MKTTLKLLLSISVLALMLPVSTSAEPRLTLLGYGWGYWAGLWQWLDDSANYYSRVSLADESTPPDGDYMVRFNRTGFYPASSSMSYEIRQATFSVVNGQVKDNLYPFDSLGGPIYGIDSGDEFSATCERTVYWAVKENGNFIRWQSVGKVLNNPTYGATLFQVGSPYQPNIYTIDIPLTVQLGSCQAGEEPGTVSPELSSLDVSIDLGKGDFGDSHGSLSIVSTITRSALSTPLFLNPLAPSPAFDLRQDSQHAVRQVLTPTALVQVSNDTEDGSPYLYKIDFLSRPSHWWTPTVSISPTAQR